MGGIVGALETKNDLSCNVGMSRTHSFLSMARIIILTDNGLNGGHMFLPNELNSIV